MDAQTYEARILRLPVIAVATIAVFTGMAFVYAFTLGWRAVALFPLGVGFLLTCALFLGRLRDFLLFLVVFMIPLQFGYHLVHQPWSKFGGSSFTSGVIIDSVDVILMLCFARWGMMSMGWHTADRPLTLGGKIGFTLLVWIAYLLGSSLLVSVHWNYSGYEVFALIKGFLLYFFLVNNVKTQRDLRIVMYGLFAMTVFHALYICFQSATGLNYTVHGELSKHFLPREGFRPAGFFGTWDGAALMLATVLPAMIGYGLLYQRGVGRLPVLVMVLVVVVGILLTKTRSTWLAVIISSTLLIGISYFKNRIESSVVVKVSIVAAAILILASPFMVERLVTGTRGEDRLPLMYTAFKMFKAHPIFGVGVNNYFVHIEQYLPLSLQGTWKYTVHNEYLLWLSETGIIGFVLYYGLLILALKRFWRMTRSNDLWVFIVGAGFFSALIGSLPNRFFTFYHFIPTFLLYCVILALAQGLQRSASVEQGPATDSVWNRGGPD